MWSYRRLPCCLILIIGSLSVSVVAAQSILLSKNSGMVLDVTGGSVSNGTVIQQWDWTGGTNQQWNIVPLGNGYNKIVNVNSGLVLDVTGGSSSAAFQNGAPIQQWSWTGGANQQWQIVPTGDGFNEILNFQSGKVLDVTGVSTVAGATLQQWDWLGGDNQKWQVLDVSASGATPPVPPSPPAPFNPLGSASSGGQCASCVSPGSSSCVQYFDSEPPYGDPAIPYDPCGGGCSGSYPVQQFDPSGNTCCTQSGSPILIDVSGEGFQLTSAKDGVMFDFFGTGHKVEISWTKAASDNAWLVLDRDGDGIIDSSKEMFGNRTEQPISSTPNGFAALAVFDEPSNGGNGDGKIDSNDAVYSKLRLWQDKNHNGISEPDELHTLPELGVKAISLKYSASRYIDANGNSFRFKAHIQAEPGSPDARVAYDVFLVVEKQQK